MDWLLNIIAWVVGKLFGKPAGPSQEAQAAAKAATAQADLTTTQQALKTETAVAQAEVAAPKTQADVVASLDKGNF